MNENLRIRLGAVTLVLLTAAALVFAALNFQQRSRFVIPDDGVTWIDNGQGVVAWHVVPKSPADKAGIKEGDYLLSVRTIPIHRAMDVPESYFAPGCGRKCPMKFGAMGNLLKSRW